MRERKLRKLSRVLRYLQLCSGVLGIDSSWSSDCSGKTVGEGLKSECCTGCSDTGVCSGSVTSCIGCNFNTTNQVSRVVLSCARIISPAMVFEFVCWSIVEIKSVTGLGHIHCSSVRECICSTHTGDGCGWNRLVEIELTKLIFLLVKWCRYRRYHAQDCHTYITYPIGCKFHRIVTGTLCKNVSIIRRVILKCGWW